MRFAIFVGAGVVFATMYATGVLPLSDSYQNERAVVSLYRESPVRAKRLVRKAGKECLEEHAPGKLPASFTNLVSDTVVKLIKTAVAKDKDSVFYSGFSADWDRITEEAGPRADSVFRSIARNSPQKMESVLASSEWLTSDSRAFWNCISPKVADMVAEG